MPTAHRQQCHEGSRRSSLPAKAPQFFKIIHAAIVEQRKLVIPKKFARKYGNNLSNSVILKVLTGAIWRVELVKHDGEIWLVNGWQEFAEYYSIGYGHFLVFRYEGNSHFHVLIFDMSATEIEYPFNATQGEEANLNAELKVPKMEETENDVSVELLDDFPFSKKSKKNTPLQYCPPREMIRLPNPAIKAGNNLNLVLNSRPEGIQTNDLKVAKLKTFIDSHCLKLDYSGELKECSGGMPATRRCVQFMVPERRWPVTANERARAFERAKAFKSKNPFFMVRMQPSYLGSKFTLNIPLSFVMKYFTEKHNNIVLRVSDGKTWSVKCIRGTNNAKLTSGWRVFARDNCLKVGDVCVFELIKETDISLKVIIFQVIETSCQLST